MTQKATAEVCELMEACLRRTLGLGTRLACAELAEGLAGDCIRIACKLAYRTTSRVAATKMAFRALCRMPAPQDSAPRYYKDARDPGL